MVKRMPMRVQVLGCRCAFVLWHVCFLLSCCHSKAANARLWF